MTTYEQRIPRPLITQDAAPYWQGVNAGRLLYQRCASCGAAVWQPRSLCPYCLGTELPWQESRGRGTVYSFSTIYRPPEPVWASRVPYTVGIVHLEEDYYLFSEIVGRPDEMRIGAPVAVFFDRIDAELTLPKFRLLP